MFGVTEEVKVGVKSQVVIPAKIRDIAKIGPGDVLIMTTDRNGRISLVKKPQDWAKAALVAAKAPGEINRLNTCRKSVKRGIRGISKTI